MTIQILARPFFGPGSEGLMNEMQAIMEELRQSGELLDTAPLGIR